jgi:uncharacterized membrane-anchored protein YitT (DUF2179 family)
MNLDIQDVLASAVGSVVGRFFIFLAAIWLGCSVSLLAMVSMNHEIMDDKAVAAVALLVSPFMLFSVWAFLNVPFLIFYLYRFLRGEGDGFWIFGLVIAVEAVFCFLGYGTTIPQRPSHVWLAIVYGFSLVALMELIIFQIRRKLIEKWEREIEQLREANALRAAEKLAAERERMSLETSG